ncbi:MAG: hypothetical protein ACLUEK_09220 [Oscillospiraceae bacterium]
MPGSPSGTWRAARVDAAQAGNREYGIVYNGEIYNADELKRDLLSRGCGFETTCDTEVILYGYMEYGMEIAEKLNGIFAFCYMGRLSGHALSLRTGGRKAAILMT